VAGLKQGEAECGVCYYLLSQQVLNRLNTSHSVYEDEHFFSKTALFPQVICSVHNLLQKRGTVFSYP